MAIKLLCLPTHLPPQIIDCTTVDASYTLGKPYTLTMRARNAMIKVFYNKHRAAAYRFDPAPQAECRFKVSQLVRQLASQLASHPFDMACLLPAHQRHLHTIDPQHQLQPA
jgi:hypothetical protein